MASTYATVLAVLLASCLGQGASQPLPVTFTLDPALSNWTWLTPPRDPSAYVSVDAQPSAFQLAGSLVSSVTGCSADRFNNNVTGVKIDGSSLSAAGGIAPRLSILSVGAGNLSGLVPTFNLGSGGTFSIQQQFGEFTMWWQNPSATWRNITGYIESGHGFNGGPVSNSWLTSGLGAFGQGRGFLTNQLGPSAGASAGAFLNIFINSTFELDPRQLLKTVNATGATLNQAFGPRSVRTPVELIIVASAPNPCALFP